MRDIATIAHSIVFRFETQCSFQASIRLKNYICPASKSAQDSPCQRPLSRFQRFTVRPIPESAFINDRKRPSGLLSSIWCAFVLQAVWTPLAPSCRRDASFQCITSCPGLFTYRICLKPVPAGMMGLGGRTAWHDIEDHPLLCSNAEPEPCMQTLTRPRRGPCRRDGSRRPKPCAATPAPVHHQQPRLLAC